MNQYQKRDDDFVKRREHLKDLSNQELNQKFWTLLNEIVSPMLELAEKHTTPAIERSVLLRMGFSSLEAQPLVDLAISHHLISFGVGNLVYTLAKLEGLGIREAGLALLSGNGWDLLHKHFNEEETLC